MLHALRHQPLAGFADMAQLAFEARNVAVDRVELALNRIGRIAGRIVIGSRLFQLTLDFAQPCGQLFDLGRHLLQFGAEPLRLGERAAVAVDFDISTFSFEHGEEDATPSDGPVLIKAGTCWGWDQFL